MVFLKSARRGGPEKSSCAGSSVKTFSNHCLTPRNGFSTPLGRTKKIVATFGAEIHEWLTAHFVNRKSSILPPPAPLTPIPTKLNHRLLYLSLLQAHHCFISQGTEEARKSFPPSAALPGVPRSSYGHFRRPTRGSFSSQKGPEMAINRDFPGLRAFSAILPADKIEEREIPHPMVQSTARFGAPRPSYGHQPRVVRGGGGADLVKLGHHAVLERRVEADRDVGVVQDALKHPRVASGRQLLGLAPHVQVIVVVVDRHPPDDCGRQLVGHHVPLFVRVVLVQQLVEPLHRHTRRWYVSRLHGSCRRARAGHMGVVRSGLSGRGTEFRWEISPVPCHSVVSAAVTPKTE